MQNIVTWGQNMSANIEEFACTSMGGLFSGVPPNIAVIQRLAAAAVLQYPLRSAVYLLMFSAVFMLRLLHVVVVWYKEYY